MDYILLGLLICLILSNFVLCYFAHKNYYSEWLIPFTTIVALAFQLFGTVSVVGKFCESPETKYIECTKKLPEEKVGFCDKYLEVK